MSPSLPRDPDGYIDIDMLSDAETDLDLPKYAPVPPPSDELWSQTVQSALYADPDAIGIDVVSLAHQSGPLASTDADDDWDAGLDVEDGLGGPGSADAGWLTDDYPTPTDVNGLEDDGPTDASYDGP